MSERNYYVICDDNCKFESMTKEQIIEAIAEATGETPVHIDDAFITKIKEQNRNTPLKFWIGTQAEYNALETIDNNCFYIFSDTDELAEIEQLAENKAEEVCAEQFARVGKVLYDGDNMGILYGDGLSIEVADLTNYSVVAVRSSNTNPSPYALCFIIRYAESESFEILGIGTNKSGSTSGSDMLNVNIHGTGSTITKNHSTKISIEAGTNSATVKNPSEAYIKQIIGIM